MRSNSALLILFSALTFAAHADNFYGIAVISDTLGMENHRLCIGAVSPSLACPTYAPSLTTAGDVSVTGNLSAAKFIGDGSGLTNISTAADRITSGTSHIIVSDSAAVTVRTGGSDRLTVTSTGNVGIGSTAPQTPLEVNGIISSTGLSVTGVISASSHVVVGTSSATCGAGTKGAIRYSTTSGTIEYCNSTAWSSLGISATDAVPAFTVVKTGNQSLAPNAVVTWEEAITNNQSGFNLSTERFVAPVSGYYYLHFSGLTKGDTTDGDFYIYKNGVSARLRSFISPYSVSAYRPTVAQGVLYLAAGDYVDVRGSSATNSLYGNAGNSVTTFSGFLLGGGGGGSGSGGATTLDELTDVDTTGAASGKILAHNGTNWEATAPSNVISTTTMITGWPDAIDCYNSAFVWTFLLNGTNGTNTYYESTNYGGGTHYEMIFSNATKQVSTPQGDCTAGRSVDNLYSSGQAFNFIGGSNGAVAVSTGVSGSILFRDTNGSPTAVAGLTYNPNGISVTGYISASGNIFSAGISTSTLWVNGVSITGSSVINTLDDVGDVSATTPANNSLLRYNTSISKWESVPVSTGVGATSMKSGAFPDAIVCSDNGNSHELAFVLSSKHSSGANYRFISNPTAGTDYFLAFNSDGSIDTTTADDAYITSSPGYNTDCNRSISEHAALGHTFNFIGSNGAVADGSAGAPSMNFSSDPDTGWWRPTTNTIAASTGGTERVRIDSAGTLTIQGTTYLKAATHIEDGYSNTTSLAANMYINSTGRIFRSTSSQRYKKNVTDYPRTLEEIVKLRPVLYQSLSQSNTTVYAGFIAEEVAAAGLTEFVEYDSKGRPDALHYGQITAAAIKGIKDLKAENDALKVANHSFDVRLRELEAELQQLKKALGK